MERLLDGVGEGTPASRTQPYRTGALVAKGPAELSRVLEGEAFAQERGLREVPQALSNRPTDPRLAATGPLRWWLGAVARCQACVGTLCIQSSSS